jgi:plasmid stability protein
MKTTIDIPDDLLRRIKIRAVNDGRKLKDEVADLLRKGLDAHPIASSAPRESPLSFDPGTGLPVIRGRRKPSPEEVGAERIAEILMDQEVEWYGR